MYITGGSAGLGLSLARLMTKRGAHVSIVARNEEKLSKALASLEVRLLLNCLLHNVTFSTGTTCHSCSDLESVLVFYGHSFSRFRIP